MQRSAVQRAPYASNGPDHLGLCALHAEDAIVKAIGCNDAKIALIWLVVQKARG